MRALLALLLLASTLQDQPSYAELAQKVRAGDQSVDLRAVRFACGREDKCEFSSDTEKEMVQKFARDLCAEALPLAGTVLENNVVEPHAYFVRFVCYQKLGEREKSEENRQMLVRLMASYTAGGLDGRSHESAIPVAEVHEEHAFIQLHGLSFRSQAKTTKDGHHFDIMKVQDKEGAEQTLYFNIDEPYGRLMELFKSDETKPAAKKEKKEKPVKNK